MPVGSARTPIAPLQLPVIDRRPCGSTRRTRSDNTMEATLLLQPLPPFRAKPSRRPLTPKRIGADAQEKAAVSVKARRHPIKVARIQAAPALKVLRAGAPLG